MTWERTEDPALGYGRTDKDRYLSAAWAAREWDRVFRCCWLYAVPASVVAEPRSFATFDIGPEGIVITRTESGELRAFYNVCQHRGRRLVDDRCGSAGGFVCPYHAWSYRLDGSVRAVFDRIEVFPDDVELPTFIPPVRVDVWAGLVFVCMDPDAPPLREYLGVVAEHLASYPLDRFALVDDQTVQWDCNWKVAMDAFHESYHTLGTHPQMMDYVADTNVTIDCYDRHTRFHMPWGAPAPRVRDRDRPNATQAAAFAAYGFDVATFEGTADDAYLAFQHHKRAALAARGYPVAQLEPRQFSDVFSYTLFPNVQIAFSAERCLLTRHRPDPTDPQRMLFDAQSFSWVGDDEPWPVHPEPKVGAGPDFPLAPDFLMQDARNAPAVQAGMRSAGFAGSQLGDLELRIRHFHSVLDRYMALDSGGDDRNGTTRTDKRDAS